MDTTVALVQAYLNVNGYFIVVEYPLLEADRGGQARTVTDLDVVAFRFPHAGYEEIGRHGTRPLVGRVLAPDPMLGCPPDRPDMIVGEVKEGAARFNAAARDAAVLEVALARFGCCPPDGAQDLTRQLLSRDRVETPMGHTVRMVAFGATAEPGTRGRWLTVPMPHAVQFLRGYLRQHWEALRHTQIKDTAFGVLVPLEQWGAEVPHGHDAALEGSTSGGGEQHGSRRPTA